VKYGLRSALREFARRFPECHVWIFWKDHTLKHLKVL